MPLVHFLLAYDREKGALVTHQAFDRSEEAVRAYEDLERTHRDDTHMEIVLIGADSLETVMLTHGNYFEATASASPYLAGI